MVEVVKEDFFSKVSKEVFFFEHLSKIFRLFFAITLLTAILASFVLLTFPDRYLHIWFLNVGQGDATLIKTPANHYFLIDGGPSGQVVNELGKVLPFWQRKIDAVLLTHPQADHMSGLIEVMKRFQVERILINPIKNDTAEWREFFQVIRDKQILIRHFWQSELLVDNEIIIQALWPPVEKLGIPAADSELNSLSLVSLLKFGNFRALLLGDSELGLENPALEFFPWQKVDLMKIPHHGSKNAVSRQSLSKLLPKLGIISAGKGNSYNLPNKETIEFLEKSNVRVLRTDQSGTIEVVSDGRGWLLEPW